MNLCKLSPIPFSSGNLKGRFAKGSFNLQSKFSRGHFEAAFVQILIDLWAQNLVLYPHSTQWVP